MVKRFTEDGHEYWEPPYSKEEERSIEKWFYSDVRSMIRSHRWAEPRPPQSAPTASGKE